jgi:low temperature requirement protein LtrA
MPGQTAWRTPPRLRTLDDAGEERRATWLELFFDLVFVVAVAQLATGLGEDTSVSGFLRFIGLFFPVLWAWTGFTFYANRFDTDDVIYRAMKCAAMLGMAAMAVNVTRVRTDAGSIGFALSFVSVRAVVLLMYARALRHVRGEGHRLVVIYLTGFGVGAALWLASIAVPLPERYYLWGLALAAELALPVLGWATLGPARIHAPHITERYGLFFIIVLGESIIAVVTGTGGVEFDFETSLVAAASFVCAVCVWWIYFDLADTSVIGRGMLGLIYMYGHFVLLAGVAGLGVGAKLAIKDAHYDSLPAGVRAALCGGVAAYLLALAVFHVAAEWTSLRDRAFIGRLVLAALAVGLALGGGALSPVVFVLLLAAGLLAQLVLELLTPEEGAASVWQPAAAG